MTSDQNPLRPRSSHKARPLFSQQELNRYGLRTAAEFNRPKRTKLRRVLLSLWNTPADLLSALRRFWAK